MVREQRVGYGLNRAEGPGRSEEQQGVVRGDLSGEGEQGSLGNSLLVFSQQALQYFLEACACFQCP